jgi:putative peptidoglycan lipid II flippase
VQALTLKLVALSTGNLGLAFLFQWYVLTQIGPGVATDALFAGMAVPQVILAIVANSLTHVLVPLLAGEAEAIMRRDAWTFLWLTGAVFGGLALLLIVLAPAWMGMLLPGFSADAQDLARTLTQIQLVGMVFAAISGVQTALHHAQARFVWPELSQALIGAGIFVGLVITLPRFGVFAAAWLATLRLMLQTLALLPAMGRPRRLTLANPTISSAWQRMQPLILGTAYYKTDPLIDRFLLSYAVPGSMSLYYLAQQLYGAVAQILSRALVAPVVPLLGSTFKHGDLVGFRKAWRSRLAALIVVCVVAVAGLVLVGLPFLRLLIGHGSVTDSNVSTLWWIMVWLVGMFVGGVVGQIAATTFYAKGDTRTPTRISVWTYTGYIPAKIAAFFFGGLAGLAVVTSVYYVLNALLLLHGLRTRDGLRER